MDNTSEEKILVEREPFFVGIALVLSIFEEEEFVCTLSESTKSWDDDDLVSDWGRKTYVTYSICSNDKKLASHKMMSSYVVGTNGCVDDQKVNMDLFAKYSEIKEIISPLFEKYPYLSYILDRIKDKCTKSYGSIDQLQILEIAKNYVNKYLVNEEKCKVLNKFSSCINAQ